VESGIPTFRDALTGLWSKFDSADLATPEAFARGPEMVSRWYDERRCNVAKCIPPITLRGPTVKVHLGKLGPDAIPNARAPR
jgi:NAD-dependent SIR2 family protein deacetylase